MQEIFGGLTLVKRINFFGVPSVGKTTMSTGMFHFCKARAHKCELISELAREWAYADRPIKSFDQIYLATSQMHREDTLLSRDKVEFIITDSPMLLNIFYSEIHDQRFLAPLMEIHELFEQRYPSVNLYIKKNPRSVFESEGRHHSKSQLAELSERLDSFLSKHAGKNLHVLETAEDFSLESIYDRIFVGKNSEAIPLNTMNMLGRPSDEAKPRMGIGIGKSGDPCPTITKQHGHAVMHNHRGSGIVRKIMPEECERLQGFPSGYTAVHGAKGTQRMSSLGNSMAVSCMGWIGGRIETERG